MFWKQQLAISVLVLGFATVFASYYDEEAEKPPYTVIGGKIAMSS